MSWGERGGGGWREWGGQGGQHSHISRFCCITFLVSVLVFYVGRGGGSRGLFEHSCQFMRGSMDIIIVV